ncbi:DUF4355 domain-containing protein [Oscillibacter valericigenes]|uniref:capsid assembly scaffolding protein Gp46 family protein n=1 Tax=Oscillibacter valericigenes TaxID=351091 RepID=UPI001F1786E2|nr:DUF4355 domain-containing protein [Oscillibacter valericigenes]MCF2617944.1 DUF4355 domain-containing protein [Oscillibacter valericigenes]
MTDEERQELETLRAEKLRRNQSERAAAALSAAGAPKEFATLLTGSDDADTDRRVQEFCGVYQASLAADVKSRLPQQPPVVTSPPPQRPRRGIQRIR